MLAAMASLSGACSISATQDENGKAAVIPPSPAQTPLSVPRRAPRRLPSRFRRRPTRIPHRSRVPESHILAAESFRRLCDTLLEIVPRAAKSFEDYLKVQSQYFQLQLNIASFAQANTFRSLS